MPKLKRLSGQEVVKIFLSFGFRMLEQKGSHIKLRRFKNEQKQTLVVPTISNWTEELVVQLLDKLRDIFRKKIWCHIFIHDWKNLYMIRKRKNSAAQELEKVLRNHRAEIFKKYNVKEIGVFGSYTRGEQRKKSDVDILVEYDVMPDLLKFIELENYLQKLLKRKVDLMRKGAIRRELRDYILKGTHYI